MWMEKQIHLRCPEATVKMLKKKVRGEGGFQSLLRELGSRLTEQKGGGTHLVIDARTAERIKRYATKYGKGGWQERLRSILRQK